MHMASTVLDQGTIGNGVLPLPPSFTASADERTYIKERLACAYRIFAHFGFDDGLAGHITVRDPEQRDCFWVNPLARYFGHIKASDLLLVDHQGQVIEGHGLINRAAFAIHSRIHAARPDVNAIAHAHSRYGRAWSALGRPLEPITQDACVFYENHGVHTAFSGVVHEREEGDAIAAALSDTAAAILQNHGIVTVGASLDIAVARFVHLERCCETQLLAASAGVVTKIDHEVAVHTRDFNGSDLVMWGYFQPLYQKMLALDPSFLD